MFTGKELDEDTGLYYYGARYYDPRTSLWQSADPALGEYLPGAGQDVAMTTPNILNGYGRPRHQMAGMGGVYTGQNLNLYHYSHLNPVNFKDRDGNVTAVDDVMMFTGLIVVVGTYLYLTPQGKKARESLEAGTKSLIDVTNEALSNIVFNQSAEGENEGAKAGPKAGEKYGDVTVTEDDELDEVFDPDAMEDEKPRSEEEADAIRDAVRGSEGVVEMEEEQILDPKHEGEVKIRVDSDGRKIRLWEDTKTGARSRGKIKQRYLNPGE